MLGSATRFRHRLLTWYGRHQRRLPWRPASGEQANPYHVLLSEAMLQQTQVATVEAYFRRFIERLPTLADLAAAPEQQVLLLWQGLGYYSRARNLHAAAKLLIAEHQGVIPQTIESLLKLPGVGRYTAGAIASLAFGRRAPILDGNVQRVLCRIDGILEDPRTPAVRDLLWQRAEQLLPRQQVDQFNSALMDLGATVCTPRSPSCLLCPVQAHCAALRDGKVQVIPAAAKAKPRPLESRWTLCIQRDSHWLIERRPPRGRWAGLWQFITIRADGETPVPASLGQQGITVTSLRPLGRIEHDLTHRRYRFHVFICRWKGAAPAAEDGRAWIRLDQLVDYPLPRPHLRIAEMLRSI